MAQEKIADQGEDQGKDGAPPALNLDVPEPARAGAQGGAAAPVADESEPAEDAADRGADSQNPDLQDTDIDPAQLAADQIVLKRTAKPLTESWKDAIAAAAERMDGAALADAAAKGTLLNLTLTDQALGIETAAEEPAEEVVEQSAFDRDEITDPTADGIDPLMAVLGGAERPWQNEGLSFLEKMSLYGYNRNMDALRATDDTAIKINPAAVAIVAAGTALAARAASAAINPQSAPQQPQQPARTGQNGAGDTGRANKTEAVRDPATQDNKTQTQMQAEAQRIETRLTREGQYRQNVDDMTLRRVRDMAADAAVKSAPANGARGIADEMIEDTARGGDGPDLDLGGDLTWTAPAGMDMAGNQSLFDRTMNYLYAQLDMRLDQNATPWRQDMWAEKQAEFVETAATVTSVPETPALRPPEPAPALDRNMQISFTPGMGM